MSIESDKYHANELIWRSTLSGTSKLNMEKKIKEAKTIPEVNDIIMEIMKYV